jgi:serine/threonine protein kinase
MIQAKEITSFDDTSSILLGVAKGLEYMHANNVIHGDITPSNILIMEDYTPIVSDFTLTTFKNKGNEVAFGTLFWRSPECLLNCDCTEASDVWSFGVMMLDCAYSSIYFRDVLDVSSNEELFITLKYIIGQPPLEWVHNYMSTNTDLLFTNSSNIQQRVLSTQSKQRIILGSEEDQELFFDLLKNILKWEPTQRYTMEQVIKHPFFNKMTMKYSAIWKNNPEQQKENLLSHLITKTLNEHQDNLEWTLQWRNTFEKQHLEDTVRKYYQSQFHSKDISSWLVQDIVRVCKKVIENLRCFSHTFNIESIVKWTTAFYCFIWLNKWNESDEFQSAIYHIVYILDFIAFPLKVNEYQLGDHIPKNTGDTTNTEHLPRFKF